ncbi:MAG: DUF3298 domain-containing protein [bacterium]
MKKKTQSNIKNIVIAILVVIIATLLYHYTKKAPAPAKETAPAAPAPVPAATPISISEKDIKEDNFTGKQPVITGSAEIATAARAYIDKTVGDFRTQANADVPDMRAKFGADSPPATYTIEIEAKYQKGGKTDSIILTGYAYTGGANGNSSYKVFTASHATGKMITLSDAIKSDQQAAFTAFVKKKLIAWRPQGSDTNVVFADAVGDLNFSSFDSWSMDSKNLTIYFDKYEIGPGVLGAVPFLIPLTELDTYLAAPYK